MKPTKEYFQIHNWIYKNYGKAKFCTFCDGLKAKRFEWALKKGRKYEKNIYNFFQLCPSCHRKYDMTKETRMKMSLGRRNIPAWNRVSVVQYDLNNKAIKTYKSLAEAGKEIGILRTSISNNLQNRSKTAGGFIWRYQQKK